MATRLSGTEVYSSDVYAILTTIDPHVGFSNRKSFFPLLLPELDNICFLSLAFSFSFLTKAGANAFAAPTKSHPPLLLFFQSLMFVLFFFFFVPHSSLH